MDTIAPENTCRLCTNRGKDYHAIFTSNSSSISDKINNCLPILISADDGLPSHICSVCLTALNTSDALRAQSLASDKFLRDQLTSIVIKQERDLSDNEAKDDTLERHFCAICEENFDDMESFDEHMKKLHSSEWVCNLCEEDFKTSDALLQHKHTNHYDTTDGVEAVYNVDNPDNTDDDQHSDASVDDSDKDEDYRPSKRPTSSIKRPKSSRCNICKATIETEELMVLHKKFHEPRSMYCSHCFHSYPSPYELFCHKKVVHKMFVDQAMKWFCEQCERFSANPKFFEKHAKCKRIKFKCKYCTREYAKRRELIVHQKKIHFELTMNDPEIEKSKCPECDKIYIDKVDYRVHVRTHRVRLERKYGCKKCDGNFLSLTHLRAHMDDIHVKKRDHQCDLCHKAFTSNRSLMAHRKRHIHQTCQECGELFENIRILNKHLLSAHNITTQSSGKFVCKECDKKFAKLRLLQDHINIHSGERPHVCEICGETFRTYAARWSHVQKHKNNGFYCDYCQRKFSTKGHVRRHLTCHCPRAPIHMNSDNLVDEYVNHEYLGHPM